MTFRATLVLLLFLMAIAISRQATLEPGEAALNMLRKVLARSPRASRPSLLSSELRDQPAGLNFTDIIKVFEADAYFKGKWVANDSANISSIFNGFDNRNGDSQSYFEVDNLETRVTTVITYFKDEVLAAD